MFRRRALGPANQMASILKANVRSKVSPFQTRLDGRRMIAGKQTATQHSWRSMLSVRAATVAAVTSIGLYFYLQNEKQKAIEAKKEKALSTVGRPKLGGPFSLLNHRGERVTDQDFKGKFSMVYFGFTRCPDICPDELDKLTAAIVIVNNIVGDVLNPMFITCDPARDPPSEMAQYLADFHPKITGLTGTHDEIQDICKKFRVYFSTPKDVDPVKDDYLVDHSVFFYLMDPNGQFVEVFGRNSTAEDMARAIGSYALSWKKENKT
ncbi:mitochondrial copper chaperone for cytochrome c oxidase Sco1 [Schizosaccharomyces osmophilus]|uniref:Mitochondrial copper chaperone for cytochrome c oxidase Sco1 n=1 Tax=Schizosaccharomyces osmophilus TaxID=2545709 RepID=A0AAF0AVJ8_9SCHI|nr:mitochondrial copper chaperone for cytochrome c oxidase Sco1 [Schizosaccharomyces osmophilus]WBW72528.1 mitochondrial copper chaperone for cytochrome c oxidase Sco1 [Schizosaccharomyces osmophilus]